jgi:hypothetical protein
LRKNLQRCENAHDYPSIGEQCRRRSVRVVVHRDAGSGAAERSVDHAVTEANPTVEAIVGTMHVAATVSGSSWTVNLPAGLIDPAGTQVTIVAKDSAGNQGQAMQRVRVDATPPVLWFAASAVHDENNDMHDKPEFVTPAVSKLREFFTKNLTSAAQPRLARETRPISAFPFLFKPSFCFPPPAPVRSFERG